MLAGVPARLVESPGRSTTPGPPDSRGAACLQRSQGAPALRPSSRVWLAAVLAIALIVRIAAVIAIGGRPLVDDSPGYDNIGWALATGHGFALGDDASGWRPTAMRGPSYVLMLAAVYRVAGHDVRAALVVQALLDVLACFVVHGLARRWFRRDDAALLAAAAYALYPVFVLQSAQLLTEPFVGLGLALAAAAFFAWLDGRGTVALVGCGAALALVALAKPNLGPLTLLFGLAAAPRLGARGALRAAVVLTALVAAAMLPWLVRNTLVFHALIPGVTQGGVSFWGGTAPVAGRFAGAVTDPWVPDSLRRIVQPMSEAEASSWFYREGLKIIAADPARYAVLCVRKFFQLWFNVGFDDPPSRASLALAAANAAAYALAVVGWRRARPDPVAARLLLLLGVFWTVAHVSFCTVVRYLVPYLGLLFTFTAAGVATLLRPACEAADPGGSR